MNANKEHLPLNGLGPIPSPGARALAEKRARELQRERNQQHVVAHAAGYSHGIFEGRRRAIMDADQRVVDAVVRNGAVVNPAVDMLRYHVTGAIERGEAEPVVELVL